MEYIELPLRNSKEKVLVDGDYDGEYFSGFRWLLLNGYVCRQEYLGVLNGRPVQKLIYLAIEVSRPPKGMWVKYINGNKLDCRSDNLRWQSPQSSAISRRLGRISKSKYIGVNRLSNVKNGKPWISKNRWSASIRSKYIKTFGTPEEAAIAYDIAAIKLYGIDRARTNFPKENYK